jgi:pentatricopeptide repeat protein
MMKTTRIFKLNFFKQTKFYSTEIAQTSTTSSTSISEDQPNLTLGAKYLKEKMEKTRKLTTRDKEVRKYCTKMYNLQKKKNGEGALIVLNDMRILKIENDSRVYEHAINVLIRSKMIEKANELAKKMKQENMELSHSLLAFLVNGQKFSNPPNVSAAEEYFEEIEKNHKLSEVAISSMMNVYCRARDEENLLKLLQKAKALEKPLTEASYAPLIKYYSKIGNLEKCEEFLEEMKGNMIKTSRNVYSMLIQSCRMPEQKDKAIELFEEMKDLGIQRDEVIYQIIINQMLKAKDYGLVYEFYERMKIAKVKPQRQLMYHLLEACVQDNNNVTKARKIIKEMRDFGGFKDQDEKSISYLRRMRETITHNKMVHKETVRRAKRLQK